MTSGHYILWSLLKILAVVILLAVLFAVGAVIGYGVIGGGSSGSVFDAELWRHIFSFF